MKASGALVGRLFPLVPALALATCGCGGKLPSDPSALPPGRFQVLSASARIAESYPAQVTLLLEGRLPSACSELQPVIERRDGNRIEVTIPTRTTSEVCILLVPAPIRIEAPLTGGFSSGDYVAVVNGFELRFRV